MAEEVNNMTNNAHMLEHNVLIMWKPQYNLGIPIIDEQHKGITSVINSLYFVMQNNYVDDTLNSIIDMMKDYTNIHFKIEEEFLEKIDYPKTQKHREMHHELNTQLLLSGRSCKMCQDPYQFLEFLKKWWINHICREDLKYRNHMMTLNK